MMNVTKVRIVKVDNGAFKGYANVVLDDAIAIHGIKMFDFGKGLQIVFPSRPKKDRQNKKEKVSYIVNPVNNDVRVAIVDAVQAEYNK